MHKFVRKMINGVLANICVVVIIGVSEEKISDMIVF